MSKQESDIGDRTVSSALATLSLAQSFILDELKRISPEAAERVAEHLNGYVDHVEMQHGKSSIDYQTTRVTVQMLLGTIDREGKQ